MMMRRVIYETKYEASMPDKVLELMREGKTQTQVAAHLGVTEVTLREWAGVGIFKRSPRRRASLAKALAMGRTACLAWWLEQGTRGALGEIRNFNVTAWTYIVRNLLRTIQLEVPELVSGTPREKMAALSRLLSEGEITLSKHEELLRGVQRETEILSKLSYEELGERLAVLEAKERENKENKENEGKEKA